MSASLEKLSTLAKLLRLAPPDSPGSHDSPDSPDSRDSPGSSVSLVLTQPRRPRAAYRRWLITLIATGACASGCVSVIPLTNEATCAERGMELDGVDIRSGSAVTPGRYRMYVTDINAVDVRCGRPRNTLEQCKIEQYVKALPPTAGFNATVPRKNLFLFVGYVALIFPGVYLFYTFDEERELAQHEGMELTNVGLRDCEKRPKEGGAALDPSKYQSDAKGDSQGDAGAAHQAGAKADAKAAGK